MCISDLDFGDDLGSIFLQEDSGSKPKLRRSFDGLGV